MYLPSQRPSCQAWWSARLAPKSLPKWQKKNQKEMCTTVAVAIELITITCAIFEPITLTDDTLPSPHSHDSLRISEFVFRFHLIFDACECETLRCDCSGIFRHIFITLCFFFVLLISHKSYRCPCRLMSNVLWFSCLIKNFPLLAKFNGIIGLNSHEILALRGMARIEFVLYFTKCPPFCRAETYLASSCGRFNGEFLILFHFVAVVRAAGLN